MYFDYILARSILCQKKLTCFLEPRLSSFYLPRNFA